MSRGAAADPSGSSIGTSVPVRLGGPETFGAVHPDRIMAAVIADAAMYCFMIFSRSCAVDTGRDHDLMLAQSSDRGMLGNRGLGQFEFPNSAR